MTKLEELARAVTEARALPGTKPGRASDVDRRVARAVLTALREPDPTAIAAAIWDKINASKNAAGIARLGPGPGVRDVINAYLDHILQESDRD